MDNALNESESAAPWLRQRKAASAGPSIEKTPQLRSSLNRFTDAAAAALATLFGGAFAGAFEATETTTTFDILAAHEGHPAASIQSEALDARLLMIMDVGVVDLIVGAMFGVDSAMDGLLSGTDPTVRPRTDLENRLLGELAKSLAVALRIAFAPVATFDLDFVGVNTIEDTDLLGGRDMPAISARYSIKTPGGVFRLTLVLPQSLTAPLARLFARGSGDGGAQLDPNWARRMEKGVTRARMSLVAILDEFELSLGEISRFAIGSVLPLAGDGEGRVRIECVERGVFLCKLGEQGDRYALEVEDIIARPVEPPYPVPPL
jgi:flagellar motor switch protein FliM